jgi:hypothetical protein
VSEVLHDSPIDFLHELAMSSVACVAQSVIPNDEGTYTVACACQQWETTAATREEGLYLARRHTGSIP